MSSFNDFWQLYDKKTSKEKAEKKWRLLPAKDQIAIMEHIPKYKKQQPERQYRKDPCTYLNNRSWNDTIYGDKEEAVKYKAIPDKQVSQEPAKKVDRDKVNDFIIQKVKDAYDGKIYLNDVGEVYTNRLEKFFNTPDEVDYQILHEVDDLANRVPKNRFEELPEINIGLEVRNRILKYNMSVWRETGNKIYEKL